MNQKPALVWNGGESNSKDLSKLNQEAARILSNIGDSYDTMTMSRAVGVVIQYYSPPEALRKREVRVDEQLEEELGFTPHPALSPIFSKNRKFSAASSETVDYDEWRAECDTRARFSLPKNTISLLQRAVEEDEGYDERQKSRWLLNAVLAYNQAPFDSVLGRIRTKEQLLDALRDREVEDGTRVFKAIQDGERFPDIAEELGESEYPSWMTEIDYEDDIKIDISEEPDDWTALPQKADVRVPIFLAVLRNFEDEWEDAGFSRQFILNHWETRNTDYKSNDYVFREYIAPHLTEVAGDYYVDDSLAPAEDYSTRLAQDVQFLARKCDYELESAIKSRLEASEIKLESLGEVVSEIDTKKGIKDAEALERGLTEEELERVRDYLWRSPGTKKKKRLLNDLDTLDLEDV